MVLSLRRCRRRGGLGPNSLTSKETRGINARHFDEWPRKRRRRSPWPNAPASMPPENNLAEGKQNFGQYQDDHRRFEPGRPVGVDHIGERARGFDDCIELAL